MRETRIETGRVRGVACGWPSITAFYGIPYAAPPVGGLRWRPPQPAAPWEGVRDCARPSARCPQLGVERVPSMSGSSTLWRSPWTRTVCI